MRKTYLLAGLTGMACVAATLLFVQPGRTDVRADTKESGKSPTASLLPISQVVLFSSGVGYFQREGTIKGDQRVDLSFDVRDINDLIKSMTLRDLDGGHITAVTYDGNSPIERTLQSFAVDLTHNPNFADILNQARGEKVEVVLQQTQAGQPATMTGSIIGVEAKPVQLEKNGAVATEFLNMWCADGMRSVKLQDVLRVRFLNAIMDTEFKKALETLAMSHDTQKKAVSINFAGQGKRQVKVGYVVESPIWKTSYRLVLGKQPKPEDKEAQDKKDKPYLQGWAVVENTTDEDWTDVRMALISGRPISFQMNLYDALFIKRPVVEPELFASLRPVAYSGGMGFAVRSGGAAGGWSRFDGSAPATAGFGAPATDAERFNRPAQPGGGSGDYAGKLRKEFEEKMNLGQ